MRTILLFITCCSGLWFCTTKAEQRKNKVKNIASLNTDTINYKTQVQPILQKNCSPCHFPGGKMYEKLPFDKGETIIGRESGVFKRIKNEEDAAIIRQYMQQNKMK